MKPAHIVRVTPALPAPLAGLTRLAYNLRWTWDHDTIELFRRLDSDLWELAGHNPVRMLGSVDQAQLEAAASDESFLAHLDRVSRELDAYLLAESTWFRRNYHHTRELHVAYFSAEFGLTESLSIFAGGLGVLAGDHLKAASDLGVPLCAVGLLYQQGYFRQQLTATGWQQESYEDNDFHNLPIRLERRSDGAPVTIQVDFPGRCVVAQIWSAQVGRVPLYLLDTNVAANRPEDRDITDQLYGGDRETRVKQEILLGIGGYRALEAMAIQPTVYHMNEGHSAFLALEWVRRLIERYGLTFAEASEAASAGLVFTTHTPVPAGHDYFPAVLMERYFGSLASTLGLGMQQFLALGRQDPADETEDFCMTVLALRMAAHSNGVSKLHGKVSRKMWGRLWPGVPQNEIPIGHITNGVHFRSWVSNEMNQLYDRYLGPKWREEPVDAKLWARAETIPAEELWRTHERRRERLVAFTRRRLRAQLIRRGASQSEIDEAEEVLDPEALTIGFARRVTGYKRAALLLRDVERLSRILNDPIRPVQVVYAGKAHPRDEFGKDLIRRIISTAQQPELRRRIVFLEDYDMAVARYLVQGADIWLNTPIRPQEASGTSGMKALANGALNLSTLDGWWDEAWHAATASGKRIGWAIGNGNDVADPEYRDQLESEALYALLERDVIPAFYERGPDRLPRRWIALMKTSLASLCPAYNMQRTLRDYTAGLYVPADANYQRLISDSAASARTLAAWHARMRQEWPQVRVEHIDEAASEELPVGSSLRLVARVHLGSIKPEDVIVEVYFGPLNADGEITEAIAMTMHPIAMVSPGSYNYEADAVRCSRSGLLGYTVRVMPEHAQQTRALTPGLLTWAGPEASAAST